MMESNKQSIILCQLNIQNLSSRSLLALDNYIFTKKLDILAIQETKLDNSANIQFTNMRGFSIPATNGSGGCGLYFSNIWDGVSQVYFQEAQETNTTETPQTIWALANCRTTRLLVGTAYIPPDNNNQNSFNSFLQECKEAEHFVTENKLDGIIMAGDFNARSTHWGDTSSNTRGSELFSFL